VNNGCLRCGERRRAPTAKGARFWDAKVLRIYIQDDVYQPHIHEELRTLVDAGQMSPEVFGRLDPANRYGIWWFNRRRTRRTQESEPGPDGERVNKKSRYVYRPREEWVAVPVPDSGVPREWVDQAREAVAENRAPSAAGLGAIRRDHQVRGVRPQHDDPQRLGPSRQGPPVLLPLQEAQPARRGSVRSP
jgi:hypothetical protein